MVSPTSPAREPLAFTTADDHQPAAPRIGPFADRHFLSTIWRHTAAPGHRPEVLADGRGEVVLVEGPDGLGLLGHENLVDYRSPKGDSLDLLADRFGRLAPGARFRFDSLPATAAEVVGRALARAGVAYRRDLHTTTMVLHLPDSFDAYLSMLGKKQRHETRRKGRRFEASLGVPRLVSFDRPGPALEDFFRLHRLAKGRKGRFMTDRMAALFADLLAGDGWRLDALYGDDSALAAAAVSYADDTGYYLYNSAYDPGLSHASPGVVMLSEMVRMAIDQGLAVFDFLKGDEIYKYRMGARPRSVYLVEGAG